MSLWWETSCRAHPPFFFSPGLTLKKKGNSDPYIEHHMIATCGNIMKHHETSYIPRKGYFRRCFGMLSLFGNEGFYSSGPEASWRSMKIDKDR